MNYNILIKSSLATIAILLIVLSIFLYVFLFAFDPELGQDLAIQGIELSGYALGYEGD